MRYFISNESGTKSITLDEVDLSTLIEVIGHEADQAQEEAYNWEEKDRERADFLDEAKQLRTLRNKLMVFVK